LGGGGGGKKNLCCSEILSWMVIWNSRVGEAIVKKARAKTGTREENKESNAQLCVGNQKKNVGAQGHQ